MRIVGGTARGRRLATPADGTRPTADRTREALFNTLAATMALDGARVLDLYAGTGAVGLEALSRGATDVVFVESNRRAADVLRRNVDVVALSGATVVTRPVSAYLAGAPERPFDLIYADPPYALADARLSAVLTRLGGGWLAEGATVVVERSARAPFDGSGCDWLTPVGERRYGDTALWYGRRR